MNNEQLTFEEAVEAFHESIQPTRVIPPQPNSALSELRGRTWFLRNVDGPLARVNGVGEVRTSQAFQEL